MAGVRKRMMATGAKDGLHSTPSMNRYEGATQTWKQGAILVNGSSGNLGFLVEAGADPTLILGIAGQDGSNNASAGIGTPARFVPALTHQTFEGSLDDNTGTYALLDTDMYKKYGVAKDANGIWYIDQTETSNTCLIITDFKDPVGTQAARVFFKFLTGKTPYS